MNTDVPKSPAAPASDQSTASILAGAPPAPVLNPSPAPSAPSAASAPSAVKPKPQFTGTVTGKLIFQGKVYQPKDSIGPASIRDLKKFGKLITGVAKVQPTAPAANPAKS